MDATWKTSENGLNVSGIYRDESTSHMSLLNYRIDSNSEANLTRYQKFENWLWYDSHQ